jgi:hypothetical protein
MAKPNATVVSVVTTLVVVGIGAALLAGIGSGLDLTALILLVFIVIAGLLVLEIARRWDPRRVSPKTCPQCGGLNATTAPYCKHCGADL